MRSPNMIPTTIYGMYEKPYASKPQPIITLGSMKQLSNMV